MEKRKESLSDIKLCRFCLTQDSSLTSLYDRSRDPILVTLPLKIMACVSIEVKYSIFYVICSKNSDYDPVMDSDNYFCDSTLSLLTWRRNRLQMLSCFSQ